MEVIRRKWFHESGMEWAWLVEQGDRILRPTTDTRIMQEIEGLVEGLAAAGVKSTLAEMITTIALDSTSVQSPAIVDKAADKLHEKVGRVEGCARDESGGSETPNPFTGKGFSECTHQDSNLEPTD